jgi:flagellar hook-length control protein FliK
MTMAGTNISSTAIDVSSLVGITAASGSQKISAKTQSFGDVLSNTAKSGTKTASDNTSYSYTTKTSKTNTKDVQVSDNSQNDVKSTTADKDQISDNVTDKDVDKALTDTAQEDTPDAMTIEEIATALTQIVEQIKEILGITDDVFNAGMETLNFNANDLINSDNLVSLVTVLSGEESAISLVANEDLYSSLQDITGMVDTTYEELLESTGLSSEELEDILSQLQESAASEDVTPYVEVQETAGAYMNDTAEESVQPLPVVEEKVNTSNDTNVDVYDTLPENQQDSMLQSEKELGQARNDRNSSKDNESHDYSGNQQSAQRFDNTLNEQVGDVAETAQSYTSESTESIMRQLADMVKLVKNENMTQMEMQLHPASLGTVTVSLTTKGGAVTAQFTAQSEQVRAAIEAQATQLRQNLEDQGVKIEAIEVSVESHQLEKNLDENNQNEQNKEEQAENVKSSRRGSINLNGFEDDGELLEEMQGADDATRIAMEMMSANGNSMDLLA